MWCNGNWNIVMGETEIQMTLLACEVSELYVDVVVGEIS